MEFYYGLPQMLWDNLCIEAEDLLREEQLGSHLVAIYPAGNRIYGLESYPPGIFCLYVDSVEALIDPLSNYHRESGFKVYSVGDNSCPVIMVDLFKWVQWIVSREVDWRTRAFLHAIPFGQHVIHEDPSISDVMYTCHQAVKSNGFLPKINYKDNTIISDYIEPNLELFFRTITTLYMTSKFIPNINPDWDKVIQGSELGIENKKVLMDDQAFCEEILINNETTKKSSISRFCFSQFDSSIDKHLLKNISKSVMDFYRFQL